MMIKRGQVYLVHLGFSTDNVQGGTRPAIIVSNDIGNACSDILTVIPLTTKEKSRQPTHVSFVFNSRFNTALCEQITTIPNTSIHRNPDSTVALMGTVPSAIMARIDKAILIALGIVKPN